jgi:hypothetical protein
MAAEYGPPPRPRPPLPHGGLIRHLRFQTLRPCPSSVVPRHMRRRTIHHRRRGAGRGVSLFPDICATRCFATAAMDWEEERGSVPITCAAGWSATGEIKMGGERGSATSSPVSTLHEPTCQA